MSVPLSIPLWLPFAAALAGTVLPRLLARALLMGAMALVLGWAFAVLVGFDGAKGLQDVTDVIWVAPLGIHYKLGVDGLSVALIAMTALLFLLCLIWALNHRQWHHERRFLVLFALAETGVFGALMAQDLILFVLFFDLMLIPFLFIGGIWGPQEIRVPAMLKLFIYTLAGSLLMLVASIAAGVLAGAGPGGAISFAFSDLHRAGIPAGSQNWIFLCFAAAFLVKMPAFPFHGWMPDGYRAMPMPVLAVFSAVLSKIAAYGFLRIVLPLLPDASGHFQTLMMVLAVCSIIYGSAVAFTIDDARLVLGYSSVAQLGFIVLGIFALDINGAQGSLLQMINHGLVVAPGFLVVAYLAARAGGSESLRDWGALALRAPILAGLFLVVALATLAMPGSSNFIGELLILLGAFHSKVVIAIVASSGVVLASVYGLRLFIRAVHNRSTNGAVSRELSAAEALPLVVMVAAIVALALVPQFLLDRSEPTVKRAVAAVVEPPPPAAGAFAEQGVTP